MRPILIGTLALSLLLVAPAIPAQTGSADGDNLLPLFPVVHDPGYGCAIVESGPFVACALIVGESNCRDSAQTTIVGYSQRTVQWRILTSAQTNNGTHAEDYMLPENNVLLRFVSSYYPGERLMTYYGVSVQVKEETQLNWETVTHSDANPLGLIGCF